MVNALIKKIYSDLIFSLSESILFKLNNAIGKHCFMISDPDKILIFENKINTDIIDRSTGLKFGRVDRFESLLGIIYNNTDNYYESDIINLCQYGTILRYIDEKDIIRLFYFLNKLHY